MERNPSIVASKRVIELGAGKGVVGIAAAILDAAEVVVTEHPGAIASLSQSVDANRDGLPELKAVPLDWTDLSSVHIACCVLVA